MDNTKYTWVWYAEWASTAILLIGCTLNALNVYPANIYWCLAGNFGWAVVAYVWQKWSLIVIQSVVSVIYIFGIFTNV